MTPERIAELRADADQDARHSLEDLPQLRARLGECLDEIVRLHRHLATCRAAMQTVADSWSDTDCVTDPDWDGYEAMQEVQQALREATP